MNKSYIAGFVDGDGSICIGKCNSGFQFKLEITQCNANIIQCFNSLFNNIGMVYEDNRDEKFLNENARQLRFCGKKATVLLNIMIEHGVIKAPQARLGLEYLQIAGIPGMHSDREAYYNQMKAMNKDKSSYEKDYSKINNSYIAGLFDAEGNVYYSKTNNKVRYYVKITQKCDPELVSEIRNFLGYGQISPSEVYRIRFSSRKTVKDFWERVKEHIIIKKAEYEDLLTKLEIPLQ